MHDTYFCGESFVPPPRTTKETELPGAKRRQVAEVQRGDLSTSNFFGILGALRNYRGLGGCGFGTPVVSYAPRPMFAGVVSLVIMKASRGLGAIVSKFSAEEIRDESRRAQDI